MKRILFALFFATTVFFGFSQPTGWNYKTACIVNSNGTPHSFMQVLVEINTQALITAGKLQSGCEDLRFGSVCGDTLYDYWIESDPNTDSTKVWIAIPFIPAVGRANFCMFYGNNTASDQSSFGNVFTSAMISAGTNVTLSGIQTFDWLRIDAGDTLFIQAGSPLYLTVNRKCIINGVIWGNGRGYQGPVINTVGTGPGGGGTSTNSGCGGGSYAGTGGMGGYDAGDAPGVGGPVYGTSNGADVDMGSSGGSGTGISTGGSGGSGLEIVAEVVVLNGVINMDGGNAAVDGTGRGGGGGSGGCIKISGESIKGSGTATANGGAGGAGTSTANDSGGGGGGGRIKLFYDAAIGSITTSVTGGIGGPYGTAAPGQSGTAGSVDMVALTYNNIPMGILGMEQTRPDMMLIVNPSVACVGDTVNVSVNNPAFSTYLWNTGDITASVLVTISDTVIVQATTNEGCVYIDSAIVDFLAVPSVSITTIGTIMDAGAGFIAYQWYLNGSILAGDTSQTLDYTINGNGIYTVVVTAVNTCSASATSSITVGIDNGGSLDAISVRPNPTNGMVYLNTGNSIADAISLFDMTGKMLATYQPETTKLEIDLSPYAIGVYFVRIQTGTQVKNVKVLKN